MVECDYCDATFESEDAYLAHLREAHEGELGTIDQRRVDELEDDDDGGIPTMSVVAGLAVVVGLGLVLYLTVFSGSGGESGSNVDIPDQGSQAVISQVQNEPAQSATHVEPGSNVNYSQVPPSSGPHYPPGSETAAGFYEEPQPPEAVVHSMEHGAVVVWYDPASLTPAAAEHLRAFAQRYQNRFGSFIATPTPVEDPDTAYVLTAWEQRLTMDQYDNETVRQFAGEYLGRGPEGAYR